MAWQNSGHLSSTTNQSAFLERKLSIKIDTGLFFMKRATIERKPFCFSAAKSANLPLRPERGNVFLPDVRLVPRMGKAHGLKSSRPPLRLPEDGVRLKAGQFNKTPYNNWRSLEDFWEIGNLSPLCVSLGFSPLKKKEVVLCDVASSSLQLVLGPCSLVS